MQRDPYKTEEDAAIDKILNNYATWVEQKYNIEPISTTVSMPNGILKIMGVEFQTYRLLTKQEAREIIVNSSQKLLSMINSEPRLQDCLVVRPFGIKNITMAIFINDANGNKVSDPIISIIGFDNGYLEYQTVNRINDIPSIASRSKESYEEAVEALKNPNPSENGYENK